jgi:hypothetical protein
MLHPNWNKAWLQSLDSTRGRRAGNERRSRKTARMKEEIHDRSQIMRNSLDRSS